MSKHLLIAAAVFSLLASAFAGAEPPAEIRELKLKDWSPRSMLVTKTTNVDTPAIPAIDVHNHLGAGKQFLTPGRVARYLAEMDAAGVRTAVNLDGMWGNTLQETLDALDNAPPGRFLTYAQIYAKNAERILYFGAKTPAAPAAPAAKVPAAPAAKVLKVPRTDDFQLTGDGSSPAWQKAAWEPLNKRPGGGPAHASQFKVLHSPKGLYVLFHGADRKLTATLEHDFDDLWNEDVFEVFLWPDERQTVYFEYEISPLNHELAILVPNFDGRQLGWRPWHYEGPRKTRKATSVSGGVAKPGADISGWTAEVFIPYALLAPLGNVPPRPHTRWRANFYRVDYDGGQSVSWDWSRVGPNFHEFQKFGVLEFE